MAQFFAMTSRGLVDVLVNELTELGMTDLKKAPGGVFFESNWSGCYRANLRLRTATRVLLTILDFPAYNQDDLYNNIRRHDFTKYIELSGKIAVDASARSEIFRDQRFVTLKVKDAIVDQFREKYGERPDVDSKNPDLVINVRVVDSQVSVGIDTSGEPLFRRGYRGQNVEAPLKEHVAAGLLDMTEWNGKVPLVDPMCGSGTFLIEAALKAMKVPPGSMRKRFAFQGWKGFQQEAWDTEVEAAMDLEVPEIPKDLLYGYDIDRKAVIAAQMNAKAAGVDEFMTLRRGPVELCEPPLNGPGIVIANPPYGARLGEVDLLKDVYRNLGFSLKTRFKGWTAWVLSGEPELPGLMGLKSTRRIPVYNGPIECRFLKYEIRS